MLTLSHDKLLLLLSPGLIVVEPALLDHGQDPGLHVDAFLDEKLFQLSPHLILPGMIA